MPTPPTHDGSSSSKLLLNASRGDVGALEVLLTRHLPGLQAYVRVQAGPLIRAKESVSDLVQSVCREVLEEADRFEDRGEAAFRQWLFTAALRKIIDRDRFYRAEKRDAGREVDAGRMAAGDSAPDLAALQQFLGASPSRAASLREELEHVEEALRALPDEYRSVIVDHRIVGLSIKEIAAQSGRTPDAIRALLGRALARLSTVLRRGQDT